MKLAMPQYLLLQVPLSGLKGEIMKSRILFLAVCTLVLATLKSIPCHAQADALPDQFETTNAEPFFQTANPGTVIHDAGNFHGTFTLPFSVNYADATLQAGTYSVSIDSFGRRAVVTFTQKGNSAKIELVVTSRSSADGLNSLILASKGRQRMLTAISLKKPGITLHVRDKQRNSNPSETELVPIYTGNT